MSDSVLTASKRCNWKREKKRDIADEAREITELDLVYHCKTYLFYFERNRIPLGGLSQGQMFGHTVS